MLANNFAPPGLGEIYGFDSTAFQILPAITHQAVFSGLVLCALHGCDNLILSEELSASEPNEGSPEIFPWNLVDRIFRQTASPLDRGRRQDL